MRAVLFINQHQPNQTSPQRLGGATGDLQQRSVPAARAEEKHLVSSKWQSKLLHSGAPHLFASYLPALPPPESEAETYSLGMGLAERQMLGLSRQDCSSLWDAGAGLPSLLQAEDLNASDTDFLRTWHPVSVFASILLCLASYWFSKY